VGGKALWKVRDGNGVGTDVLVEHAKIVGCRFWCKWIDEAVRGGLAEERRNVQRLGASGNA
jgi:hypothetical protein